MRIEDLRLATRGDRARAAATVIWEDCDRCSQDVYFETTQEFASELSCDPHAFLVGAVLPAIARGEERIAVDAPICPDLRDGVVTAIGWLRTGLLLDHDIRIESSAQVRYPHDVRPRAASFLSGGVDSSALLRTNRLLLPKDHPSSYRDCLFVHGFDIGGLEQNGEEADTYELALSAVSAIAHDADAVLIPVFTNVRHLYDDVSFWMYTFNGAALASTAHAFSLRLTSISIASDFDIPNLTLAANHPLVEPNLGSSGLRIRHGGLLHSRIERVRLISGWDAALDNLRVCTMNPPGRLNCGRCEKCLRTMLELLALGVLERTSLFGAHDVLPEMLKDLHLTERYQDAWYSELVLPLSALGRLDLVNVIQRKRAELRKRLAWQEERDWKGAVKRFDRRWLGQTVYKTYRTIRNLPAFVAARRQ